MNQVWKRMLQLALALTIGAGAFVLSPIEAQALVKKLTVRGYLYYRNGARGKRYTWHLRLYTRTGIIIGSGRDKDGYAEFFGTYNRYTKRFYMTKYFKYRRRGRKKFYYKGKIIGRRLRGSAHFHSYWGKRYAGWSGRTTFSRYKLSLGRPKRIFLTGKLRYRNSGRSKRFTWRLRYYPSSGRCFGTTKDRDGRASFEGVYDKPTKRFFLRKRFYGSNKDLYYRGKISGKRVWGTARGGSFTARRYYATWRARMLWKSSGVAPHRHRHPRRFRRRNGIKHFTLIGRLRYRRRPRRGSRYKTFTWKLRFYRSSGKCFGETSDRDGKASFFGSCDPDSGRLRLKKRFRGSRTYFYYTGRLTKRGARGVARRYGFRGRIYATWKARVVRRTR